MSDQVVVVGASLAGLRAVETARDLGYAGRLILVGAESHLPYDRPPLSKDFLRDGPASTTHLLPASERLLADLEVELLLGSAATGLDPVARTLVVDDAEIAYDELLVTTGVRPHTLPGQEALGGVHQLRTLDDAAAIHTALAAGARTVVVGGGFIGAEIASAAALRGLAVTIVEAAPTPLVRAVGAIAGDALATLHARHGAELRVGVGVERLLGEGRVEAVLLTDGTQLPADLVVVGIGAAPNTEWLEGSGLALDDGIICDSTLRAAPGVHAAGDVARWTNPLFDRAMRLEHWTNAGEQAAHAMTNILHPTEATQYNHVPYFWSDWYARRIQFAGLPVGEPLVVSGDWDAEAFVALYREGERLIGALTLDRRGDIMKYRGLIARHATWSDALDLADRRNSTTAQAIVAAPSRT